MPISDVDSNQDEILIVAAEASSCMYAIRFIEQWRSNFPQHHFFGIGDKKMADAGVDCYGFAEELAVVGIQEVIKHYPEIKKTGDDIIEHCDNHKPKFALLLDYPGFNLRLAKKLKKRGIPVVYYISPQLWAWKKGRVKQVREYVDDMLVVFPFEVEFYKKHNIDAQFVGHPLVEVVNDELKGSEKVESEETVLGLMPGSRKSEINYNFLVQLMSAKLLSEKQKIKTKVLVAPTLNLNNLKELAGDLASDVEFVQGAPTEMIKSCDIILSASGTATLQVALCEKPMVVMYKMNPITAFIAKLIVRDVKAFCIVNLIGEGKFIPEFFQEKASARNLSQSLEKLIVDKDYKESMLSNLKAIKERLGEGMATKNVVEYLKKKYY